MTKHAIRYPSNPIEYLASAGRLFKSFYRAFSVPRRYWIDAQFQERLILAVTSVNHCSHCSFLHSQIGLEKGLSAREIQELIRGDVKDAPEEQAPALLYAQHWSETKGRVSAGARTELVEHYGEDKTRMIELYISMAYWGNMSGNIQEAAKGRKIFSEPGFGISYLLSFIPGHLIALAGKLKGIMNSDNRTKADGISFS